MENEIMGKTNNRILVINAILLFMDLYCLGCAGLYRDLNGRQAVEKFTISSGLWFALSSTIIILCLLVYSHVRKLKGNRIVKGFIILLMVLTTAIVMDALLFFAEACIHHEVWQNMTHMKRGSGG